MNIVFSGHNAWMCQEECRFVTFLLLNKEFAVVDHGSFSLFILAGMNYLRGHTCNISSQMLWLRFVLSVASTTRIQPKIFEKSSYISGQRHKAGNWNVLKLTQASFSQRLLYGFTNCSSNTFSEALLIEKYF